MYYISPDEFQGCTSESLVNLDQVAVIGKEGFDYGNFFTVIFCYGVSARKAWTFKEEDDRDAAFKEIQYMLRKERSKS